MEPNVKQFKVRIPEEQHLVFKETCTSNKRTMTQVIGDLITEYLEKMKRAS